MTATSAIGAAQLAQMLRNATDWLGVHREQVNALNVFPVPDGDTGSNMHLTMQSVRREMDGVDEGDMNALAGAVTRGALLGARGNSGVILSQFLHGLMQGSKGHNELGGNELKAAFGLAQQFAYNAVKEPLEGTILTVARGLAEGANSADGKVIDVLNAAIEVGQEMLLKTEQMLPALTQAGVVDSGGQGLMHIVRGMRAALTGEALPEAPTEVAKTQRHIEAEEYGYCTEFLLTDAEVSSDEIRELIAPFGDSLLVVEAEGLIKGHIHTDRPDEMLALVGKRGRMLKTKVEDMSQQHHEILMEMNAAAAPAAAALLAVGQGDAVVQQLRALGARVISGGQTANPSVMDIADAARSVAAESIIILPNNRNVIMAAQAAAELIGPHALVLPTRTIGQGFGAATVFDGERAASDQLQGMQDAAEAVMTLEVTNASRSTTHTSKDGGQLKISEGDFIGLCDGDLTVKADNANTAALDLLRRNLNADHAVVTVFFGNGQNEAAEALESAILAEWPELEVLLAGNGPNLYSYLILVE